MRGITRTAAVCCAMAVIPAVALAGTTIYSGQGTADPAAKIELKLKKKDGKRKIRRITVDKLRFEVDAFCSTAGRTDEQPIAGKFRVKNDGTFRAIGATTPDDVADSGELKVKGDVKRRKIVGKAVFTFGKDGCKTDRTRFKATP